MSAIELQVIPHRTKQGLNYQHLHIQFTTPDALIEPSDLKGLKISKNIDWKQGVVIEGKAPLWLYAYLTHECHPAAWVGCYDPRLGAVVVSTHSRIVSVGQVLKLDLPA